MFQVSLLFFSFRIPQIVRVCGRCYFSKMRSQKFENEFRRGGAGDEKRGKMKGERKKEMARDIKKKKKRKLLMLLKLSYFKI